LTYHNACVSAVFGNVLAVVLTGIVNHRTAHSVVDMRLPDTRHGGRKRTDSSTQTDGDHFDLVWIRVQLPSLPEANYRLGSSVPQTGLNRVHCQE
jgi:hypothetical protein